MRIKRIKIKQDIVYFEENFSKNDNIICVLDNLTNAKNYYKNLFLKNLFDALKISRYSRDGENFLTECDVNILNNDDYTVRVKGKRRGQLFSDGKRGVNSNLSRSYFASEKTFIENERLYEQDGKRYLEEFIYPEELRGYSYFDEGYDYCFDAMLSRVLRDIHPSDKAFTCELIDFIKEYLSKTTPIQLYAEEKLHFKYEQRAFEDWIVELHGKNGKQTEFQTSINKDVLLIEYIVAHNVFSELGKKLKTDFNLPIFIEDVFDFFSPESTKTIMELLKSTKRQVFIILRNPNSLVESYADKLVNFN